MRPPAFLAIAALASSVLTFAVLASPLAAQGRPSPEEVRSMAYAGQVVAVDAAFAVAHHATVAGEAPFDEVRALVEALVVTDPAILDFTGRWLEERPDLPYAKAVRALQLHDAGFAVRGSAAARWTWGPALAAFAAMHAEGMDLAQGAYAAAPDLVAASDAVFWLNLTTDRLDGRALRLMVADVMEATPSRRSLANALASSKPAWGGEGPALMAELCEAYATRIVDAEGYTIDACLADHVLDHGYGYGSDAAEFVLAQDSPVLADDRVRAAALRPDLAEKLLREALASGATDDLDAARAYDVAVAGPQGLPPLFPEVLARAREAARRDLLTDPFDAGSLDVLAITDDAFGQRLPDAAKPEEVAALLRRRVLAAPFDPGAWSALGDASEDWPDPLVGGGEPMWINPVAYSNHSPSWLARLIDRHILTLEMAVANDGTGYMSDGDLAFVVSAHLCPMERAVRLWVAACDAAGATAHGCDGPFPIRERLDRVRAGLVAHPECPWERDAPLADLAYTPIDVALG